MTRIEFIALCGKYLIAPSLALENEDLCDALRNKDVKLVEKILKEQF
jgi:hypothetical protein